MHIWSDVADRGWSASFAPATVIKNTDALFKAKTP